MTEFGTPPDITHLLSAVHAQGLLLERILDCLSTDNMGITASDNQKQSLILPNDPVPGAQRLHVGRPGFGTIQTLVANVPILLLPERATRIGGLVTTSAAVSLVLCSLENFNSTNNTLQVPRIFLQPNMSWDMKLGDVLWTGNIVAVSGGTPNVYAAEV